jgi:metal-responsive CopG/Arc/MetJ family transcriptional regulator
MQRPSDPKVTIRIPKSLLDELDDAAKNERYDRDRYDGRGTRSAIIRRALNVYFHHRML